MRTVTLVVAVLLSACSVGYDHRMAEFSMESYSHVDEFDFPLAGNAPLSAFAVDVDTASYSNVRGFLAEGVLPYPDAVRVEEMINYFNYQYPTPAEAQPFSTPREYSTSTWNMANRLAHIGLKSAPVQVDEMPPSNLVVLIDVASSMNYSSKLPLLMRTFRLLVEQLGEEDRVGIVVYAGAAGVVLEPTRCSERDVIQRSLADFVFDSCPGGAASLADPVESPVGGDFDIRIRSGALQDHHLDVTDLVTAVPHRGASPEIENPGSYDGGLQELAAGHGAVRIAHPGSPLLRLLLVRVVPTFGRRSNDGGNVLA